MEYKLFQKQSPKGWGPVKLLSKFQINKVRGNLGKRYSLFTSIQTYSKDGVIEYCPLYADFDGPINKTRDDAVDFVMLCMELFGIEPYCYFSGSKGFHVVVPYKVAHPRCGEIVGIAIEDLVGDSLPTLDRTIYGYKRMWRLNGSVHQATGLNKIRLTLDEFMNESNDKIKELASTHTIRTDIPDPDLDKADEITMIGLLNSAITNLPPITRRSPIVNNYVDIIEELTPCLIHLINHGPAVGERNRAIYIFARFFKNKGVSESAGKKILLDQPHYQDMEDLEDGMVSRVFKSVYSKSENKSVGCRSGADSHVLKQYCSKFCWFNPDFPEINLS